MRPNRFFFCLAPALFAFLTSCETMPPPPTPAGPAQVGTSSYNYDPNFLRTGYAPLERWLDERFPVSYRGVTLDAVFNQHPLKGIRYDFVDVPPESKLFHLEERNTSRREVIERVAKFYDLTISIENINGKPAYAVVRGNAIGSGFDPNREGVESIPVQEL